MPHLRVFVDGQGAAQLLAVVVQIGQHRVVVFAEPELALVALARRHRVGGRIETKLVRCAGLHIPPAVEHELLERAARSFIAQLFDANA